MTYRYPWPASALTPADMAVLHAVRESGSPKIPMTELIARAVRATYGSQVAPELTVLPPVPSETQTQIKEAA